MSYKLSVLWHLLCKTKTHFKLKIFSVFDRPGPPVVRLFACFDSRLVLRQIIVLHYLLIKRYC